MTPPLALLRLASRHDEALWRAALDAHGVPAICMPDDGRSVSDSIDADARLHGASALVVDVPVLESFGHATSRLPGSLARTLPGMRVFARRAF